MWVIVPKSITVTATTDEAIYTALETYAKAYRTDYTDTWYEGCGLTEVEYNTNKSKMLNSIKTYGGFWIGRYELGTGTQRKAKTDALTKPLLQANKYPYNFVTVAQSQERSSLLAPEVGMTSSLMYGIQWDLMLKFIEEKGTELGTTTAERQVKLKTDSSSWGNYNDSAFTITKGEYSTDYGKTFAIVPGTYTKLGSTNVLLTTAATERNKVLNIYDIAGNVHEWTLEKTVNASMDYCTGRGGAYYAVFDSSYRVIYGISNSYNDTGSRPTLFK